MENKNELVKIIEKEKLPITQSELIIKEFQVIFEKAKEYELKIREIKVTDISQVEEMKNARKIRLELQHLRTGANKKRIELKEDSVRIGRAIQGIYNVIDALIVPMEDYLDKQEKFVLNIEKERIQELSRKRNDLLRPYLQDEFTYADFNLGEKSEAGFNELLNSSKIAFEQRNEEKNRLENEILENEKKQKEENERIKIENEKLKAEQKIKDDLIDKQNKEKQDLIDKQKKELAEEKRKRDEQDAKIAADEKIRQEKIKEENRIKKENEDRIIKEKRQAELAPDKEKLNSIITILNNIELPEVKDEKAKQIIVNIKDLLSKVSIYILENTKNL